MRTTTLKHGRSWEQRKSRSQFGLAEQLWRSSRHKKSICLLEAAGCHDPPSLLPGLLDVHRPAQHNHFQCGSLHAAPGIAVSLAFSQINWAGNTDGRCCFYFVQSTGKQACAAVYICIAGSQCRVEVMELQVASGAQFVDRINRRE